ncbi:hypothetical protein E2C01_091112 [Portunus trituberculatus]|uniref:Uncharacterized protein n=1 Tax=Portunus trituberculatus TaxID=210409 RepID=A0A5B7JN65_PORTR|nr:hypothetical protein [Portunus trituberculatus]
MTQRAAPPYKIPGPLFVTNVAGTESTFPPAVKDVMKAGVMCHGKNEAGACLGGVHTLPSAAIPVTFI